MKIALVHDYLAQDGGAEEVLRQFHVLWPDAPIFVLFHKKGSVAGFDDADVRESFLAKFPFAKKRFRWLLPLMPMATERHDLREFDVVLSSTSAFAKGVITRPNAIHISYCHTPTRYLWSDTHEYLQSLPYNPLIKWVLPFLMHRLRVWDKSSVDRVDVFIANSKTVQARIKKYYRRDSQVIYPPVDVSSYPLSDSIDNYFLAGGRLVPYKRFDLIIAAFNRLGWPLTIFGSGPELASLQKMAKKNIVFVGRVSEEEKRRLMSRAKAFIHPQLEDLGITPLESMACGRPVIAYGKGGVTETVVPGKTGVFFERQTWSDMVNTLLAFDETMFNPADIRAHAEEFDVSVFTKKLTDLVTAAARHDLLPYDHRD